MKGYCTFLQLGRYGRFANQIFQIAGTIGIARKNDREPVFPVWCNYDHAERFGSKEDINVFEHFTHQLPPIPKDRPYTYRSRPVEWGYHAVNLDDTPPDTIYDLSGHFQSLRYFEHCIDEVRRYMIMKEEPKELQPAVMIHARRGDYDNKYHPVIPVEWYVEAVRHFPATSKFYVFSDKPAFISELVEACEIHGLVDHARNMRPIFANYLKSFAIMKRGEHFIIGNSSYSAAAAMLSESKDKQVIAPATWFGPGYASITGNDIYCPGWKVL